MAKKDLEFLDRIEVKSRNYLARVEGALKRELDRYASSRFHGPLNYAVEGGKRIRPLVLVLMAEAFGRTDDDVLDAAVAVELLHAESIIHDDIIDQEVSRRGRAAFHVKYGYSASLLTADFVFSMILAIAARYRDSRVADALSSAALEMCEGEYTEITIDPDVYNLPWEEYMDIISKKTASLFETSSKLGGLLGGATGPTLQAVSDYGRNLGIAYQLHDDILDWGAEDKITVALKHKEKDEPLVERLESMTATYAKRAKDSLSIVPDSSARTLLKDLTDFSVSRNF